MPDFGRNPAVQMEWWSIGVLHFSTTPSLPQSFLAVGLTTQPGIIYRLKTECRAILETKRWIEKDLAMPLKKLKEYLDSQKIKYVSLTHSPAFTAMEVAESAHVPGHELAKTVIVKLDGVMAMAVVPSTSKVDLNILRESVGAAEAKLATEAEFQTLFPDCETGAMPPFGNLYGLEVFVAPRLAEDDQIAFNAGSHTEVMKLAYKEFERLVKPKPVRMTD